MKSPMYAIPFLDIPPLDSAAGVVQLPGSKSISNRVLLLAALSGGTTRILDLLDSDDTRVMLEALRALGCGVVHDGATVRITGMPSPQPSPASGRGSDTGLAPSPLRGERSEGPGGGEGRSAAPSKLFLGNAGTAMRPPPAALAGPFAGKPKNLAAIEAILEEIDGEVPVQLGGGIRDLDTIDRYVELGIEYVIIGTAAVKHPGFLQDACVAFPGHVMVGLDAKDGKVAIDGWSRSSGHDVVELARKFEDYGVEAIVYTDIGRDGMLSGVNVEATARLARALRATPVIASGGIASLTDIEALCAIEEDGVIGAITGRAIYEGTLDFKAAQALADELAARRSAQRTA